MASFEEFYNKGFFKENDPFVQQMLGGQPLNTYGGTPYGEQGYNTGFEGGSEVLHGYDWAKSAEAQKRYESDMRARAPYQKGMTGALGKLQDLVYGKTKIEESPAYKFRLSQGLKALERTAAAKRNLFSGRAGIEAQQFGQNLASSEFEKETGRLSALAYTPIPIGWSPRGIGAPTPAPTTPQHSSQSANLQMNAPTFYGSGFPTSTFQNPSAASEATGIPPGKLKYGVPTQATSQGYDINDKNTWGR